MYTFLKALSELYNISKIVQVVSESVPFSVTLAMLLLVVDCDEIHVARCSRPTACL